MAKGISFFKKSHDGGAGSGWTITLTHGRVEVE